MHSVFIPLAYFIGAAFVGCFFTLVWLLRRSDRLPKDHPNERSLHTQVTPRIGGIGIVVGVAMASISQEESSNLTVLLSAGLTLASVSLLDDYFNLPAKTRLLTHLGVVAVFLLMTLNLDTEWLLALPLLLALTWMTNLYNFMDGSDGLAGGMTVFGFAAYAGLAGWGGQLPMALLCASVSAAALAFLMFNFPPARLFMGDAGSVPLGFLAGAVGLLGWRDGLWHWAIPFLLFSPFIVDATMTLLRRGIAGEKLSQAHHQHYYQRLVRSGWSHRRLVLAEYGLMAAGGVSSILVVNTPEILWGLLMAWSIFYVGAMQMIDRRWQQWVEQYEPR